MSLESWIHDEAVKKFAPVQHPLCLADLQEVWEIIRQMKSKGIWQRGNDVRIYFNQKRKIPIPIDVYDRFAFIVSIDDYHFGICYINSRGYIGKKSTTIEFPRKYFVNMTPTRNSPNICPVNYMGPEYLAKSNNENWMDGKYCLLNSQGEVNVKPILDESMGLKMIWQIKDIAIMPILAILAYIASILLFPFGYLYPVRISHYEFFPATIILWSLFFTGFCTLYIQHRAQIRREEWFFKTLTLTDTYPGRRSTLAPTNFPRNQV